MQGLKGWWIDCYDLLQDPAHHCVHAHRANTNVATGGEPSKEQHLVQLSKKDFNCFPDHMLCCNVRQHPPSLRLSARSD